MKTIIITVLLGLFVTDNYAQESFYDFVVKDIYGEDFAFSTLKGKKVLIVNTASKCGYTKQYKDLEKLFSEYKEKDFIIIGFPANNFLSQEPGTNEEIITFCQSNYGVTFPMMSKISVKGEDIHPLYVWLTSKDKNGFMDSKVSWNFQKYLIDEKGNLVDVVKPKVNPYSEKILLWLDKK